MAMLEAPLMLEPRRVTENWTVLPSYTPVPGLGCLAVNSFLLKDREPMLIDTGLAGLGDSYIASLEREIDIADLRWIWLSHMDADHIGNIRRVLDRAPKARIVTNPLGKGKMNLAGLDVSRVDLMLPGTLFDTGSRVLRPVRPPYYDAPESVGFFDPEDRVFFAVDSFGALFADPVVELESANQTALRDGMVLWSSIDAPWLGSIDQARFGKTLSAIRRIAPEIVLCGHLPVAKGDIDRLVGIVNDAWCSGPSDAMDPLTIETVARALN